MQDRLVVYTLVLGWPFALPPVPQVEGVDYICFTDQRIEPPDGWQLRFVTPILASDVFRSSREQKVRPHRWLSDYARSLYVDSSVLLKQNPNIVWNTLVPSEDVVFGGLYHSFRGSVAEEFNAVLREKLEFAVTLREHFDAYIRHHADALRSRPIWGGMLARRHNDPGCIDAMETWFCHVMRYSRRDQLSLPLALAGLPDRTKHLVEAQLHETVMHKWPHSEETKPPYYRVGDDGHESAPKPPPHASKADGVEPIVPASKPAQRPSGAVPPPPGNAPRFAYDPACDLYFVEQGSPHRRIYVSHKQRLALYKKGITHRQNWILGDYRLPHDLVREGDVVVDVGANIGELGLWVADRGGRYVAFEPDPKAFRALRKNVSGDLYDVALSDDNGSTHFYLNTAEADSSLFQPAASDDVVVVRKARLDDFLEEIGRFDRIRLLKVEAEGMEPEVLAGAAETLDVVEYVAVDAGPERGGEDTVPPVMNILTRAGFEVRDCFLTRGTFLLRNTALSPAECARGSTIASPQAHAAGRALSGEVCAVRRPESASRQ